ncbi:UDP-N-acetylmuramoyl-L-alanyl-D-glutamate--2,6-diaminopimelate ligase [Candidatus Uhrbacteria bacterium]|nr:UDP-N-acetylmuramoyl-L-alanyl-D-glutamate--2,6-diaminopimelate ligase [Candidatus Uhrbacteria bacterium]
MIRTLRRIIPKSIINTCWHLPCAVLAAVWFRFPARRLTCVAVAGTKGKTTTTVLTARMLAAAGHRTACVSTAVVCFGDREEMNTEKMTTPSAWWIQRFLRRAVAAGCTHAVLEVSSHALLQYRTFGIPFSVAVLTNLAPDHLEYHRDAREYQETHRLLCTSSLRALVLNGDDPDLQSFACAGIATRTFSAHGALADRIRALPPALPGEFNVMNALAAATAADALGIPWDVIVRALTDRTPVPGRLERIEAGQDFTVIVDYAHSPESLERVLGIVGGLTPRASRLAPPRTIAVFGACGERDPKKRPIMGAMLDRYADVVIVTNDDPYGEDPEQIAQGLRAGIRNKRVGETLFQILDRRTAIAKAIALAQPGDLVLILGKGAEQWQVFRDKRIPWDDRTVARELLSKRT